MKNRKLSPTFKHVFDNGDFCYIQYESRYVSHNDYINDLKFVYYNGVDVTRLFRGAIGEDETPLWMYKAIEQHANILWDELNNLATTLQN